MKEQTWKDVLGQIAQSEKFTFLLDGIEYKIHAYIPSTNHLDLISVKGKDYQTVSVDECKLIARPVSDMSEMEWLWFFKNATGAYIDSEEAYSIACAGELYAEDERLLLSIGVLPESFADEDVIWEGKDE